MDVIEKAAKAPCVPVSWGTIAQYVGKGKLERNESHTHKWMVFLRGAHNQDISYAISKVTFELHRDYENYRRGLCDTSPLIAVISPRPPFIFAAAVLRTCWPTFLLHQTPLFLLSTLLLFPLRGDGAPVPRLRDGVGWV